MKQNLVIVLEHLREIEKLRNQLLWRKQQQKHQQPQKFSVATANVDIRGVECRVGPRFLQGGKETSTVVKLPVMKVDVQRGERLLQKIGRYKLKEFI